MTQLKQAITWSNLSKGGSAFLLVWLGAACGGASPTDESGSDGGPSGTATDGAGNTGLGSAMGSTDAVNLGTAGSYAILAESGISSVPNCAITGNLGLSPAAASFITGFGLIADSTNVFSTSPQVTGKVYAADYTAPTPSNLTTAIGDMQIAFTDAAGRAPNFTERGAGNIGGLTLTPGVYRWSTGLLIPTDVTLSGSATDVWIFQIAQDLTMSDATNIVLAGGAASKNVFWQVSGSTDVGTTAHFEGTILTKTAVALRTGASIEGRLLAQTAVSLESNAVVAPSP
jgi:ice-binding like protein